MADGGPNSLSLQANSFYPDTVAHEHLHALGFTHEHVRPDRDQYVNKHWENIWPG